MLFGHQFLGVQIMSRRFSWLDTGSNEALTEGIEFVQAVEKRTGLKIVCLEKIAINFNWIDKIALYEEIKNLKGDYFKYLKKVSKQ